MVEPMTVGIFVDESSEQLLKRALALEPTDACLADLAQRLKTIAETEQNSLLRARALFLLGKYYSAHYNYLEAINVFESGWQHCHLLAPDEQRSYLLLLCKSHFALGQFESLTGRSSDLLKLARETADPTYEIEVQSLLGSLHVVLGIFDTALQHFDRAVELVNQASSPLPAHLLFALGRFYYAKSDGKNSLYYYERGFLQALQEKDRQIEGVILNNIGVYYSDLKDYARAIDYYLQAMKASRECGDAWTLTLECNNLGVDLLERKRFASARRYFYLALGYIAKLPSTSRESLIKGNLGELAQMTGDIKAAQQFLHESLELAIQSRDSRRLQERYEDLALFYESTGDLVNALKYHKLFHRQKLQLVESSASVRSTLLQNKFELEKLRQEQEIHRLKNLELSTAVQELEQLSNQDGLTGLFNRRFFDSQFQAMFDKQLKKQQSFCVMLADIDNFKKINDTFSHTAGDEVLKIVAGIFMNSLRDSDIVARYGGEEIVALFPKTSLENAVKVCERIRIKIEGYPWQDLERDLNVTISIGIAENLYDSVQTMLSAADAKLYQAKRKGKNRVVS